MILLRLHSAAIIIQENIFKYKDCCRCVGAPAFDTLLFYCPISTDNNEQRNNFRDVCKINCSVIQDI